MYRNKLFHILTLAMALFLISGTFAYSSDAPRAYPKDSVVILQNDKVTGEFTKEFPLPNGETLQTSGPCAVKMNGMILGVHDRTKFSLTETKDGAVLRVLEGTVYFGISKLSKDLSFSTPGQTVDVEQVILNASTDGGMLRGVINVTDGKSRIGVLDGGALQLATLSGSRLIKADQVLDFTPKAGPVMGTLSSIGGLLGGTGSSAALIGGAAVLGGTAAVVGGGMALKNAIDDDDDDDDASPSTP